MLDKKKSLIPIAMLIVAIVSWGIKTILMPANVAIPISKSTPIAAKPQNSNNEKKAQEVTVRVLTEAAPGSGVTIWHQGKTYTVLTCQHVVEASKKGSYRVLLPDGRIYPARLKSLPKLKGLDLALIEFESETTYRVSELGDSLKLKRDSVVYASGFPNYHVINRSQIEETINWGRRAFRFTAGKVGFISSPSLPQGYSLGYTNEVELGMSGGPVFNDKGELVGINGRLKYPIQGINAFIFADGTKPSVETFQKMEALSWAIPIATYQQIAEK